MVVTLGQQYNVGEKTTVILSVHNATRMSFIGLPDTPTFISGLNAWTVVLVVEHEEYLGAVDLTSDVVNIPTGLASYSLV